MKPYLALGLVFATGGVRAQTPVWQPSPGHTQIPIWPKAVPDALPATKLYVETTEPGGSLVAGKQWVYVENVSRPTMTVYSPTADNTGAAVVVFPGGGDRVWPSIWKARRSVTG